MSTLVQFPRGGSRIPEFDQADRLRKSLRLSTLSQQQIAEALGVTRETVSTWINGRIKPTKQSLILWAQVTDVDLGWLERGELPTSPKSPDGNDSSPVTHRYHKPIRTIGVRKLVAA